jgi:hypothetical protein
VTWGLLATVTIHPSLCPFHRAGICPILNIVSCTRCLEHHCRKNNNHASCVYVQALLQPGRLQEQAVSQLGIVALAPAATWLGCRLPLQMALTND